MSFHAFDYWSLPSPSEEMPKRFARVKGRECGALRRIQVVPRLQVALIIIRAAFFVLLRVIVYRIFLEGEYERVIKGL